MNETDGGGTGSHATNSSGAYGGAMDGHAEDDGRVYQASGDQHISEHHHYGSAPATPAGPDSVRRPTVGRTPVVLRDRTDVLERLRTTVASGPGGEIYVLHGMGGCGKTAVAHAFFQVATTEYGRAGLWVNAADRASLRAGMLAVAADRSAGDGELLAARNGYRPAADLVWHYLDRSAEPWLLVLDNADDPSILGDGSWLRTSPRGTVLVTTRRAAPGGGPARNCSTSGSCRGRTRPASCTTSPRTPAHSPRPPRSPTVWAGCRSLSLWRADSSATRSWTPGRWMCTDAIWRKTKGSS